MRFVMLHNQKYCIGILNVSFHHIVLYTLVTLHITRYINIIIVIFNEHY